MSSHRIDDGRVQRSGVQQKKESCQSDGGDHYASFHEQRNNHHRNSQQHAGGGNQVVGAFHPPQQIVAQPAARQRGHDPIDHDDHPESEIRRLQRIAAFAVQELRHPYLDTAERVRHRGHAEGCREERRVARYAQNRAALRSLRERVELPALRLLQEQHRDRQQEARNSSDIEREAPAMVRSQIASQ